MILLFIAAAAILFSACGEGAGSESDANSADLQTQETHGDPGYAAPELDLFVQEVFIAETTNGGDIFFAEFTDAQDQEEAQEVKQLKITSVVPPSGSHKGGEVVTVLGEGFDESVEIFFGDKAAYNLFLINEGIINCSTPPSPPSKVSVRVSRGDGEEAILENGFEFTSEVVIESVYPYTGDSDGGMPVIVKGSGFTEGTRFLFGTREAISVTIQNPETAYMITPEFDYIPPLYGEKSPAPDKSHFVNLHAVKGDEVFTLKKGFEYAFEKEVVVDGFSLETEILAVSPSKGDVKGGEKLLLAGKNFKPGIEVYIGPLPAKNVKLLSGEMMSAATPQGSAGLSDVILRYGGSEKRLTDGFEYVQDFQGVLLVEPSRGSQAGGAIVKIIGSGLPQDAEVSFGEYKAAFASQISSNLIIAKTPFVEEPSEVELLVSGAEKTPKKFLFYNPANKSGGTSGERIDGAVNISVFDGWTGKALKKAFVIIGSEAATPHKGRTDDRGQITFSDIGLEGKTDVTAIKEDYSAMTIAHFDAENATLHLSPTIPPQPGDPPVPMEPINCKLRGVVVAVEKYIPVPEGIDGKRKAYCETTSSSIFGYNPPPGPLSVADKNGEFEVFSRSGQMAVVCYAGVETDYGAFIPLRMGLTKNIVCKKSERIDGIKVYLTIPMDEQYFFRLSHIPEYFAQVKKPTIDVSLQIPMNGYLKFNRDFVEVEPRLYTAKYFPAEGNLELEGDGYTVYTTVRTGTPNNIPYSVNLLQKLKSVRRGEFLFVDHSGFRVVDTAIRMPVEDMAVDAAGNLLAVSSGGGMYWYDGNEFYIFPAPENNGVPLYSIGAGQDGAIYVGGEWGRIFKLDYLETDAKGWEQVSSGWNSPAPVREIVESDGAVFFAGGNQVQVLEQGILEIELVDSPPYKIDIRTAVFYGGKLFVGSSDGLVLARENSGGYTPVYAAGGAVYASYEYEGKLYMAGAPGMIIEYDGTEFIEKHYEPFRDIFEIARTPDGKLLFAGERGYILIKDGEEFDDGDAGQDNDYIAAADYGGSLILAGRGLVLIEPVLSFPVFEYPLDSGNWDGLKLKIKEFAGVKPSYHQFLFSLKTGYLFYNVVAGGEITEIAIPPLKAITGIEFPPPDYKRVNLTSSLSPEFNIDQYSSSSMNFYKKKGYSVNVIGFY
ncbi:MAG: IPT/TIG domain-containing protein [Deltaproteobacteria bacterium]|nr:IPT/TIG domain-containing protein [Deltaproteobacteria bacterium]